MQQLSQQARPLWHACSITTRALRTSSHSHAIEGQVENLEELVHRNVLPGSKRDDQRPSAVLTTRREALALYRHVLRWSNLWVHKDPQGRVWRDVIRQNARKEFEEARFEQDPQLVSRMIITGRDCADRAVEMFMRKRDALQAEILRQEGNNQQ